MTLQNSRIFCNAILAVITYPGILVQRDSVRHANVIHVQIELGRISVYHNTKGIGFYTLSGNFAKQNASCKKEVATS